MTFEFEEFADQEFQYEVIVEVHDHLTYWGLTTTTRYDIPVIYNVEFPPEMIVAMLESGKNCEFQIFDNNLDPFSSGGELYPGRMLLRHFVATKDLQDMPAYGLVGTIYLVDHKPYLPRTQLGDPYENLLGLGFIPTSIRTVFDPRGENFFSGMKEDTNGELINIEYGQPNDNQMDGGLH